MNLTEDQLRAVLREAGDEIAPDRVRPLDLQSQRAFRSAARNRTESWRRNRWLQGLTAAAAVTAVAIAATAIATRPGDHRSGTTPGTVASGIRLRGVPPYYVLVAEPQGNRVTTVRDTRTGAVLATVRPPRGDQFSYAAPGAASDSFVLLAANQRNNPTGVYLLRFNAADRRTSLTRLSIPLTNYSNVISMSPNGSEVAVASGSDAPPSAKLPASLNIYTLSGRLIRQWRDPGTICISASSCLSWGASGYLAFLWTDNGSNRAEEGIRVIPMAAPSGSLLRASRLVLPFPGHLTTNFVLSGDGTMIAAAVLVGRGSAFEEFSAARGKLTARFWPSVTSEAGYTFWANQTGSTLIVQAPSPRTSLRPRFPFGVLTRRSFTRLPTPSQWESIAF